MQNYVGSGHPFVIGGIGPTSSQVPPPHITTLLLQAASSGFFPKQDFFQRHDLGQAIITWIDINLFEQRPYCIRLAQDRDLLSLLVLESACWSAPLQASAEEIRQRLQTIPGQCVLCLEGEVVAVVYSQRLSSVAALEGYTFRTVSALHTARGPIVQLLAINVLPAQQHLGLGDQLLDFMLRYSALHPGVEQILAVSLCQHYSGHSSLPLSSYIHLRHSQGYLQDPILRFHESHGARIIDLVPGYRPEDTDNQGCGVLVSYDPALLLRPSIQPPPSSSGFTAAQIAAIVTQSIQRVVNTTHPLPLQRPLRELGLQSTELLELRLLLEKNLHLLLDPVVFFRHSTATALIRYAQDHLLESMPDSARFTQAPSQPKAAPERPVAEESEVQGMESAIAIIGMACRFRGS
ncbi:MAG: hypothetical protein HC921_08625 [Synechococcaceae cyanobacterium SM2_3_1]|nr:hypothetical protein [Synechococcaceae cyanobacterium SM2_3_1]